MNHKAMGAHDVLCLVYGAVGDVLDRHNADDIELDTNFDTWTEESSQARLAMHLAATAFITAMDEYVSSLTRSYDVPIRDANAEHRLSMQQLGVSPR